MALPKGPSWAKHQETDVIKKNTGGTDFWGIKLPKRIFPCLVAAFAVLDIRLGGMELLIIRL